MPALSLNLVLLVLRRLYPTALAKHNYGTTLSSLAFAGTIVGMVGKCTLSVLALIHDTSCYSGT
jgi:hypothetical protein